MSSIFEFFKLNYVAGTLVLAFLFSVVAMIFSMVGAKFEQAEVAGRKKRRCTACNGEGTLVEAYSDRSDILSVCDECRGSGKVFR